MLHKIIDNDGMNSVTISEVSGAFRQLNCQEYLYWLKYFIFEMLSNQTQTRGIVIVNDNGKRNNEEPYRKTKTDSRR